MGYSASADGHAPDRAKSSFNLLAPRIETRRHERVKAPDKVALFRQLRTMFSAGTPIHEALVVSAGQTESKQLEKVMHEVADHVSAGSSLSEAFGSHPEVFRDEWTQLVHSAEISGTLDRALERIAAQIDESVGFRAKLVSSLMYPMTVLVVSVLAVVIMLTFVVPTFQQLFEEAGKELPGPTQTLINVSDGLRSRWLLILGAIGTLVLGAKIALKSEAPRALICRVLLASPVIGPLVVNRNMHRFSRNVADLLDSGVPVLDALDAMRRIYGGNPVYREALVDAGARVRRGDTLSESISHTGVFTPFLVNMLRVGEETGSLPEVLEELSAFYRRRVETFTARAASQLETLMIIVMSCLVGAILIALYMPLFEMSAG